MPPTLPDEQAALLRAIIAQPDEDTPRLVYADWLQEHGDEEQAQFIRDSIRLSRMRDEEVGRKYLLAGLTKLGGMKGRAWVEALGLSGADAWSDNGGFVRGMMEDVCYWDLEAFLGEAEVLFARLPVRALTISEQGRRFSADALRVIAAMPGLARLRRLDFFNDNWFDLSQDGWRALIGSPHLTSLREFYPTAFGLTDDHLLALAACPNVAALKCLDLSGNEFSVVGQLAILRSSHLIGLEELSLDNGGEPEDEELIELVTARFGSDAPLRYSVPDQEAIRLRR